jgi:CheY-like chemotaxis protein
MTKPRILVIDDDEAMHLIYQMLLKVFAVEITVVPDGATGITKVTAERFDLIFLDMLMPDYNGLDFLQFLDTNLSSIPPVIVCSGLSDRDIITSALMLGASGYLIKPIDKQEVRRLVSDFLLITPETDPQPVLPPTLAAESTYSTLRQAMADMVFRRHTGTLVATSATGSTGKLIYQNGKLRTISFGNQDGLAALELLYSTPLVQIGVDKK